MRVPNNSKTRQNYHCEHNARSFFHCKGRRSAGDQFDGPTIRSTDDSRTLSASVTKINVFFCPEIFLSVV